MPSSSCPAHHGHAGDGVFPSQLEELAHRRFRSDGDGVANHAAFELLHQTHFPRLPFDGHVLMNDADAPFLSHGNGQAGFRDRIHGGGKERNMQADVAR
jgi:hypothetical protein